MSVTNLRRQNKVRGNENVWDQSMRKNAQRYVYKITTLITHMYTKICIQIRTLITDMHTKICIQIYSAVPRGVPAGVCKGCARGLESMFTGSKIMFTKLEHSLQIYIVGLKLKSMLYECHLKRHLNLILG